MKHREPDAPERRPSLFAQRATKSAGSDTSVPPDAPALTRATPPDTVAAASDHAAPTSPASPARHWYLTADLRAATGLTRTAMDFYLRAGVVRPAARTESGYLLFDADELALLRRVLDWRARGISLRDIRLYLGRETDDDTGSAPDDARTTKNARAGTP